MLKNCLQSFAQKFAQARDGVAAVEFAIGAPVLLFMLVIMTDVGLAIHARMNLDQAVRAGAEFAMNEVSDIDDLKNLIKGAATGSYYDGNADPLNPDVASWDPPDVSESTTWCECPENEGVAVACGVTICGNDLPASVYYELVASKDYDGLVLTIPMKTEIRVQVR